ncbi:hypothetical protein B0H10DRAFT_1959495 [Mycena sp. CBHHK59/15]|nr:hypothetical protein B0H10DRAFT_1959495 [Mycena sp. CBHHK59/15]
MELFFMIFGNPSWAARFLTVFTHTLIRVKRIYSNKSDNQFFAIQAKLTELGSIQSKWSRNSAEGLCNVFEPSFLAAGLKMESNLGHLIFGESAWVVARGIRPKLSRAANIHLIIPPIPTMILKKLLNTQQDSSPEKHQAQEIQGQQRDSMLFKLTVTSTIGVSIGPLEYCGNGHIVYVGSVPYVALCKGDPAIPKFHETHKFGAWTASLQTLTNLANSNEAGPTRKYEIAKEVVINQPWLWVARGISI